MKYIITTIFLYSVLLLNAQKPFECGAAYLTVSDGSATNIYKVIQNSDKTLSSTFLVKAQKQFNGVGYRRQDNLMYATTDTPNADGTFNFYQISADGSMKVLRKMPFDKSYQYYAGDVTVDGKYGVILANGAVPNKLYVIDLLDPNYGFKELTFPAGTDINSPDIAFNPEGTKLYAYNDNTKKLLEIDYTTATIINTITNPSSVSGNFSGMWSFDCAIYGYSRQYDGYLRVELEGKGKPIGNITQAGTFKPDNTASIDGCSCPPPVKLFKFAKKTINPDTCITEFKFYFAVENNCGIQQNNIIFKDSLPKEFTITKIDKNPFGGQIKEGIGGSSLLIENMTISNHNDTIVITTRLKPVLDKSIFKNQAFLKNIKHQDGQPITIKSDDPTTPEYLDSTTVKAPLIVEFTRDTIAICPDGRAKLKPNVEGTNLVYTWNTGDKTPEVTANKAGIYSVTVTSDCEIAIDTQVVINAPLTLEIGEDKNILPGDSILIFPSVSYYNPIAKYDWITTKGANLKYQTSLNNISRPNEEDVTITLKLTDDLGCTVEDYFKIKMRRNLYIPNTFSPNDDGINDSFYVFTEAAANVELLEIYDRWGNKIFEKENCPSNDPTCGWDGNYKGKRAAIGVYTYRAVTQFYDGKKVNKKGDVTLLN